MTLQRKKQYPPESGSTLAEFSIAALFLLFFIFISIQLLYVAYVSLTVQFLSLRGLRAAVVADVTLGDGAAETLQSNIITEASALGITVEPSDVHICPVSNPYCTEPSIGAPKDVISIIVRKSFPIYWGNLTMRGRAIGRNEPA